MTFKLWGQQVVKQESLLTVERRQWRTLINESPTGIGDIILINTLWWIEVFTVHSSCINEAGICEKNETTFNIINIEMMNRSICEFKIAARHAIYMVPGRRNRCEECVVTDS